MENADVNRSASCVNSFGLPWTASTRRTHPNRRAVLNELEQLRFGGAWISQHQQVDVASPA